MYDSILKNLEIPNTWVKLIPVDIEKAFNYVDHNVLVGKLSMNSKLTLLWLKLCLHF
jgi:hypothetical protein